MKRTFVTLTVAVALLGLASAANAELLVGHYDFSEGTQYTAQNADATATGISSNMQGGDGTRLDITCNDELYGNSAITTSGGESAATGTDLYNGVIVARSGSSNIYLSITNNTTFTATLATLLWDFHTPNPGGRGPNDMKIFDGDETGIQISTEDISGVADGWQQPGTFNFHDRSLDLSTAMADNTLAPGATRIITIREVGSGGPPLFIDNVAILGTVPEPTTMALLGLGALVAMRRRRRS